MTISALTADPATAGALSGPSRRTVTLRITCALLLIISLLAWRSGTYFSGGVDPVIAAKSFLGVVALALSIYLVRTSPGHPTIRPTTIVIAAAFLLVAMIGAVASGSTFTGLVLAVRTAIVLATMVFLMSSSGLQGSLVAVLWALGIAGVGLAISGIPNYPATHRLYGSILPVNANQIATMIGPPAIALVWRLVNDRPALREAATAAALIVLTYFTGSRTGLVALVLAVVIVVVMAPRMHAATFVALAAAVPVVYYLFAVSSLFTKFFERGGSGNVATLNSRTIAWSAAFAAPRDFWGQWFGAGPAVKTVAVYGTYWNAQVVDSSWVSTYVQAGLVGMALLGLFVVVIFVRGARAPKPYRSLFLVLVVYAAVTSLLETGLLDSYVLFVVVLLPALAADLRPSPLE